MYLPLMYYPLSKDNRNTGFLMPSYGSSTVQGADDQQRVLLGDQPQPGRHDSARLVFEDRAGDGRRVSIHVARRIGQHPNGLPERAPDDVRRRSTATRSSSRGAAASACTATSARASAASWYAQGRADYSIGPDRRSALQHRHHPRVAAHADLRRIGQRHDQRAARHRHDTIATSTSPRTARSSLRGERAAHQHRAAGSAHRPACRFTPRSIRSSCASSSRQFNERPRRCRQTTALDRLDIMPAIRFPFNKLPFLAFNTTAQFRNTFWSDSLLTELVNGRGSARCRRCGSTRRSPGGSSS